MEGTKATALDASLAASGRSFLRFDYSGHGRSSAGAAGTVGAWLADTLLALDRLTQGPLVLIGSSMGAWMALLALKARPQRIAGLVLVAPAADFTEKLLWPSLPQDLQLRIARGESVPMPGTDERSGFPLTSGFFEDGAKHGVLDAPLAFGGAVRILQGMKDEDVPWRHALAVANAIESPDLVLTLIKGGDHRLSAPPDLVRLIGGVDDVLASIS
jgi:pimeloyl-ACP methyl ester carboxylesterase